MAHPLPKPTDGELAILRVLWEQGPSTVREVLEVLTTERDMGYTTVLKMLQIMTDKGLVDREEEGRGHRYRATASEAQTQSHLVRDLLEKAFGGSALQLVTRALQSSRTSPEEMAEIRRLLESHGGKGGER